MSLLFKVAPIILTARGKYPHLFNIFSAVGLASLGILPTLFSKSFIDCSGVNISIVCMLVPSSISCCLVVINSLEVLLSTLKASKCFFSHTLSNIKRIFLLLQASCNLEVLGLSSSIPNPSYKSSDCFSPISGFCPNDT